MTDFPADDIAAILKIGAVQQILQVVCLTTGMGFSAVARVTDSRWVACAVRDEIDFGLQPGGELVLETTICHEIRHHGRLVVIDHVDADIYFCNHPTPLKYGFQSYISAPINLADGRFFGTLCAIDPKPAALNTPQITGMFTLFADMIAMHLDSQQNVQASEAALQRERETARFREQFIAVLGHDLRNPLSAIEAGTQVLGLMPQTEDATIVIDSIRRSAGRMGELIGNVLDFARGRLGDGLHIDCKTDPGLQDALELVVIELQTAWPSRTIHRDFTIDRGVSCDSARLAQMLSNLVANALTHGDPESPVWVRAQSHEDSFEIAVTNLGVTLEPEVMERLFEPFARGESRAGEQSLGLGLYIAAEIARAHGGTLEITSVDRETCFTFRMPLSHDLHPPLKEAT